MTYRPTGRRRHAPRQANRPGHHSRPIPGLTTARCLVCVQRSADGGQRRRAVIERWLTLIRDHPERPPAHQFHVLTMLALRMDWTTGAGFCGIRDLMADADVARDTVMRATTWARDKQLLIRTRRGHYINAQTTIASQWQLTQGVSTATLGQSQSRNGSNPRSQSGQPKVAVETTHQESSSSESSTSARGQAWPAASPRSRLEDPARLDLGAMMKPRSEACKTASHRECVWSWCTCTCSHPGRSLATLTVMDRPGLARRVMKARRDNTTCPRCRAPVRRGQHIGLVDGTGWVHVECVTERTPPEVRWPGAA